MVENVTIKIDSLTPNDKDQEHHHHNSSKKKMYLIITMNFLTKILLVKRILVFMQLGKSKFYN